MFSDDDHTNHIDNELEYEPFEDVEWTDSDDLDAIDLEALDLDEPDDEISEDSTEDESAPDESDESDESEADSTRKPVTRRPPPASRPRPISRPAAQPKSRPAASPPEADTEIETEIETEPDTEAKPTAEPEAEPTADAAAEAVTAPEAETPPGAETQPEAESPPEAPAEPVIPPDVYCALLALPLDVSTSVLELRATGEIETMPPPGVILTPHFRTHDLEAVTTALADWTRIHLPMQLEIMAIKAEIIGAQQYIAAWTLDPQEELQDAIHALKRALADLILPMPGTTTTIGPHIMIGDHVPARRYPHLISQMQDSFETHVWQSTDLQLMRCVPANESDNGSGDGAITWELDRQFD